MKATLLITIFALGLFTSIAQAKSEKKINVGFGTYALAIGYSPPLMPNDEFSGMAVSVSYASSNNVAFKAAYYMLDDDAFDLLHNTGFDFLVYFGTGLSKHGYKAYMGGGLFTEDWELLEFSEKFNGLQINGGVGYNWDAVSLDLTVGIREADDYDDPVFNDLNPAAVSSSLILSARF